MTSNSYSGLESGRASAPTLMQLRHLAISEARRRRVNYEHVERVEMELRRALRNGGPVPVRGLTEREKRTARAMKRDGHTYREIADVLGCERTQLPHLFKTRGY